MPIVVSVTNKKEKLKQHYCWRHLCTFYLPKLGKGSRSQGVGSRQRHKLDIGEVVIPGSSTICCVTKHTGTDKDKTSERNTLFGDQNLGVQGLILHNSTQLNLARRNQLQVHTGVRMNKKTWALSTAPSDQLRRVWLLVWYIKQPLRNKSQSPCWEHL